MESLLVIALGWATAGFVNGLTGFGGALVAMPFMANYMDMATAVPSCALIGVALNGHLAWSQRRHMTRERVAPLLLGAIPGAILGVTLLRTLPEAGLKAGMAVFIMVYAAWGLFCRTSHECRISCWWGSLAGFLAALFGTSFGFNGPPLVAYVSMTDWNKDTSRAILLAGIGGTAAVMVLAQASTGLYTERVVLLALSAIPVAVLGGWLGERASSRLNEGSYHNLVYCLLLAMGGHILWSVLRA